MDRRHGPDLKGRRHSKKIWLTVSSVAPQRGQLLSIPQCLSVRRWHEAIYLVPICHKKCLIFLGWNFPWLCMKHRNTWYMKREVTISYTKGNNCLITRPNCIFIGLSMGQDIRESLENLSLRWIPILGESLQGRSNHVATRPSTSWYQSLRGD